MVPQDDHHSEGSSETVGSDSGRGYSEEDDLFSTPSGGKFFLEIVSNDFKKICVMNRN